YAEAGGNFFDTADLYTNGNSERMLGRYIKDAGIRDKAVIATKFSYNAEPGNPNAGGNGRKNIMRAVEGSLERLGTDYIDLYILHTWDRVTPAEEVMRTMDDLVTSGKVRHVGLSDVPAWYAARAQTIAEFRGYERLSALQLEYSLAERNLEDEFTDLATQHGMGIMVWSPLASGLLSGKYKPSEGTASGEGRLATTAGSGNPAFEKFTDRNWAIVAELEAVAKELDRSMAQVAVNWVANRPGVASVLVGATKVGQMRDNLGALDFEIPTELLARLDEVSAHESRFPYSFFAPDMQAMLQGGVPVGSKPAHYYPDQLMAGEAAGVGED
ncbi:MAG: aldo/keto reductase, partial [Erythrobacter sp.]|nr:aldo/keto reductase [Erythrobacter sp.]